MPAFTLNQSPIALGYLTWPIRGRPTGLFIVAEPWEERRLQDGAAILRMELDDQVATWQGVVRLSPHPDGWTIARFVGGADGMGTLLKPRYYQDIPYRVVLQDAISEAGEKAGRLEVDGVAPRFTRETMTLTHLLELLTPKGKTWWVNDRGEVEVFAPTWELFGSAYALAQVGEGAWEVVMDLVLRPGVTLDLHLGGVRAQVRLERVVQRIEHRKLVTEVWRA